VEYEAQNLYPSAGLEGDLVRLRAIGPQDSAQLYQWVNTPELVRFNAPYHPVHAPAHEDWMRSVVGDPTRRVFAIEERIGSALVGVVQLVDIHLVHRNAEMRIRIGEPDARGRGLGTATLGLLLDHAWRDLGLHRVYLYVFATNERAIASYERVGFEHEGRLHEAAFIDGAWCDVLVMAVLASGPG
jgi:RimJ/RimL family protein N-acetyltransferase